MKTKIPIEDMNRSKSEQIVSLLNGKDLENAWKECLATWEDSSPAQRADCRVFISNLRDNFLRILRDVDDPQEQETVVAIFYTQVKAQWILINTQSGYQLQNGRVDGALFCRAGMLSALLGAMEPALRRVDLNRITNFLAEPESENVVNVGDIAGLASRIGMEVFPLNAVHDDLEIGKVVVDARTLENRIHELVVQTTESDNAWEELIVDLGLTERSEIVPLFQRLSFSASSGENKADSENTIARAAHAEWSERREALVRSLRTEVTALREDWERVQRETGCKDGAALITRWRETVDALAMATEKTAQERSVIALLHSEYGEEVTAPQIVQELRRLSALVSELQMHVEKNRAEREFLEREFGTFNAEQMVSLVHNLRDKIAELNVQIKMDEVSRARLTTEMGTADMGLLIPQIRELRDNLGTATREMVTLRAERYIFQNELGKTDAREIVNHIHSLEAQVESFREMSELLGSMEQALKTLNS